MGVLIDDEMYCAIEELKREHNKERDELIATQRREREELKKKQKEEEKNFLEYLLHNK